MSEGLIISIIAIIMITLFIYLFKKQVNWQPHEGIFLPPSREPQLNSPNVDNTTTPPTFKERRTSTELIYELNKYLNKDIEMRIVGPMYDLNGFISTSGTDYIAIHKEKERLNFIALLNTKYITFITVKA